MKLIIPCIIAGILAACSALGFADRPAGSPAPLEITVERSFGKLH